MVDMIIRVSVDEDDVKNISGQEDLIDAVYQEAGWMHDSGIFVNGVELVEPVSTK